MNLRLKSAAAKSKRCPVQTLKCVLVDESFKKSDFEQFRNHEKEGKVRLISVSGQGSGNVTSNIRMAGSINSSTDQRLRGLNTKEIELEVRQAR